MLFSELVESELVLKLKPEVERLLDLKIHSPEVRMIPKMNALNEYLDSSIDEIKQTIAALPETLDTGWEELNALFLSETNALSQ